MGQVHNPYDDTALMALAVAIDENVEDIKAVTDAELMLTGTNGILTTDGNEQTMYVNEIPAGIFKPLVLYIDFTAHTAGETVVIREYHRLFAGGAYVLFDTTTQAGALVPPGMKVELSPNRHGVRVSIQRTGGVNRAYPWFVAYEV